MDFYKKLSEALSKVLDGYNNDTTLDGFCTEVNGLFDYMLSKGVPLNFDLRRRGKKWIWKIHYDTQADIKADLEKAQNRLRKALKSFYKHSEIYSEEDKYLFRPLSIAINAIKPGLYIHRKGRTKANKNEDVSIKYEVLKKKPTGEDGKSIETESDSGSGSESDESEDGEYIDGEEEDEEDFLIHSDGDTDATGASSSSDEKMSEGESRTKEETPKKRKRSEEKDPQVVDLIDKDDTKKEKKEKKPKLDNDDDVPSI